MRTRKLGALSATALVLAGLSAGCGSGGGAYANADRPPAPISISIAVTDTRVQLSPTHVGAGPVLLLIANESRRSRDVTLTAAAGAGRSCVAGAASSGPINPQGAATIKLPLVEGACAVGVAGGGVPPARLVVGPQRQSAQQDLLQP
ncbi:MAG: hypothetical protein JSS99_11825 [Actinobacteria bacterium]|nr:hypothetical protein [Actinomycetota bacterium]